MVQAVLLMAKMGRRKWGSRDILHSCVELASKQRLAEENEVVW